MEQSRLGLCVFLFFGLHFVHGDVSYFVQEEIERGSVIGNIAKDLGLEVGILSTRKAIKTVGSERRYCDVNPRSGELIVSERIDREEQHGEKASCVLQ